MLPVREKPDAAGVHDRVTLRSQLIVGAKDPLAGQVWGAADQPGDRTFDRLTDGGEQCTREVGAFAAAEQGVVDPRFDGGLPVGIPQQAIHVIELGVAGVSPTRRFPGAQETRHPQDRSGLDRHATEHLQDGTVVSAVQYWRPTAGDLGDRMNSHNGSFIAAVVIS